MNGGLFNNRLVVVLGALFLISLLAGFVLVVFQEELGTVRSSGADTYSYSALGHHGFKELLEELGYPVLASRNDSGLKTGTSGVLVIAEPDLSVNSRQRLQDLDEMCRQARSVLLVIPKRRGAQDPAHPAWLDRVSPLPMDDCQVILESLGMDAEIVRGGHSRDLAWDRGFWNDRPFIDDLQLIRSANLAPLIATEEGILLGHLQALPDPDQPDATKYLDLLVLSDPDLLDNHGLRQGHNAEIAVRAIDYIKLDPESVVVFDETLHGFAVKPSVFRAFFRAPLVFVLVQMLAAAGMFFWLANGRFGAPRPVHSRTTRGLDYLLDNTAELLDFGGHGAYVLGRYHRAAVAAVCRQLHLDPPGTGETARARLINITASRSPDFDYVKMETEVPAVALDHDAKPQEILAKARALHRWQQEMTHGL